MARRAGDDDARGEQRGLPGVLPEEAPLPSEVALDGGVLDRRRREALGALRATLLDRPDDFEPEEWRVVVATLAPPTAHLPRAPGSPARMLGAVGAARECFPALSPTAAVRRFREVQARPHVAEFVADLRALEMLDVLEQRSMVREALRAVIGNAGALLDADLRAMPNEWARTAAAVTAASKVLIDMDALALRPEEVAAATQQGERADGEAEDPGAALIAKMRRVSADLRAREKIVA